MSTYPYWSLNFDLRADRPVHVMRVLTDVASDHASEAEDLALLHPVVRFYLSDWRRMLVGEEDPRVGTPVRLFRHGRHVDRGKTDCLSIEFRQHDDEYANGGWVFWLWVLSLVRRPPPHPASRTMIGFEAAYRGDAVLPQIYFVDHTGLDLGGRHNSFQQIDETLEGALGHDYGYSSRMDD